MLKPDNHPTADKVNKFVNMMGAPKRVKTTIARSEK